MKIGNAKYGGEYKKKNYYKLKDGVSIFRILPPIGDMADSGKWSAFWSVHYGYKNSQGKARPFQSPFVKNRKTKMIEAPDAALQHIEDLKAAFEAAKKAGNTEVAARLDKLVGQKGQYNMSNNHYVNVVDEQGNIGILAIRHRCKVALDATIAQLRAEGVDPLSVDNGRYFKFHRSGTGLDTTFQVSVLKRKLNVAGIGEVEQDVVHQLTPELIARLATEAAQLDKLFKRPTSEEVARMVKEGAKAVDEILDTKQDETEAQEVPEELGQDDVDMNPQPTPLAAAPTPVQAAPTPAPLVMAALMAAPTPVSAPVTSTPPRPAPQVVAEQSDDDFLKSLGLSK